MDEYKQYSLFNNENKNSFEKDHLNIDYVKNYFNEEEFVNFENFIKNHNNKFVNFTEVKKIANKSFLNKISRNIIKFSLIYLRKIIVLFNLIKQR